MIVLFIIIIIYLLSVLGVRDYIKKDSLRTDHTPKFEDVLVTLLPVINTVVFIALQVDEIDWNKLIRKFYGL